MSLLKKIVEKILFWIIVNLESLKQYQTLGIETLFNSTPLYFIYGCF